MADCTIRRRDESWIEVVLPTPSYAGELGKAHVIMMGQLGLDEAAASYDDVYQVLVGDDEVILRAKAPTKTLKVSWADSAVDLALAMLLDYRDGNIRELDRQGQTVMVAIDTLRAAGANAKGRGAD